MYVLKPFHRHGRLARWRKWRACDVVEAKEGWRMSCDVSEELILQPFRQFTYVTAHSPTLLLLHLHHSSFSNPSFASPTSQLILQTFFRFSYITGSSLTSPGEPPMPRALQCLGIMGKKTLYGYIVCVCSNVNPLHYYVLWVPHKADRWRWVWSIFESRTTWADHITCGMRICIVYSVL